MKGISELVTYYEDGRVSVSVESAAEARQVIKSLRLKKRELIATKKQVTGAMTSLRAQHQSRVAQRGSKVRGRGTLRRLVRAVQTIERDADRRNVDDILQPLRLQAEKLEAGMLQLDQAILRLEEYILDPTVADRAPSAPMPSGSYAIDRATKHSTYNGTLSNHSTRNVAVVCACILATVGVIALSRGSSNPPPSTPKERPTPRSASVPRTPLFIEGHLQVPEFVRRATSREKVAELLGKEECGRFYRMKQPPYHGGVSCTYRDPSGRRMVVFFLSSSDAEVVASVSMLDVSDLPFSDKALIPFGVTAGSARTRSSSLVEWDLPAPLTQGRVHRHVSGETREVDFDLIDWREQE